MQAALPREAIPWVVVDRRDRQNRLWGAIFGSISTREKFLAMRFELASHEWERLKANELARMPQLSQRRIDGHIEAKPARGERPPTLIVHRRENLYRLPQGDRAPPPKGAYDFGLAHDVSQSEEAKALRTFLDQREK